MKKLLFVCAGVGLAIGGGYLMYQAWKKYCQDEDSEDQDDDKGDGQAEDLTDSCASDDNINGKKCDSKNTGNKKKDNKNNFGGFKSGFLL